MTFERWRAGYTGPPHDLTDEEYAAWALRPLAGEPGGPSGVDVARAVRAGRRHRRGRWAGLAALSAAVLAILVGGGVVLSAAGDPDKPKPKPAPSLPPEPAVPTGCRMSRLPLGKYTSATVTAGDSSGRWLVGQVEPVYGGSKTLLVWHDGKIVDEQPAPDRNNGFKMTAVNSSGVAVGGTEASASVPYLYRNGKVSVLKGGPGQAAAISDRGVIAGTLTGGPVRWRSPDAEPERLPLPPKVSATGWITDIGPDGTIVGRFGDKMLLWTPAGVVRVLTPPLPTGFFRTTQFHYGWLYVESIAAGSGIWRYEPRSNTWQQLTDWVKNPAPTTLMPNLSVATNVAAVFVGRKRLPLPLDRAIVQAGLKNIQITSIDADAHVITGSAQGGDSDPSKPFLPIIWTCHD